MSDCQSLTLAEMSNTSFSNNTAVLETTSTRSESHILLIY
jgi:hypothetical protein